MINTSAPKIRPPEGSRTIPLIVPSGDCATPKITARNRQTKSPTPRFTRTKILLAKMKRSCSSQLAKNDFCANFCGSIEGILRGGSERSWSRMVGIHLQVSKEERLTARLGTAAVRFHGHEHCVDLR